MTITQTTSNQISGNYVLKRQRITFTNEQYILIHLPTFLTVAVSFPVPWNPNPAWTQSQYVANHPMNKCRFTLGFDPLNLAGVREKAYLSSQAKTYNLGRAILGTGTTPETLGVSFVDYPKYFSQFLFDRREVYLNVAEDSLALTTIALQFNRALSGTLTLVNQLYYPPPT